MEDGVHGVSGANVRFHVEAGKVQETVPVTILHHLLAVMIALVMLPKQNLATNSLVQVIKF